MESIDGNGRRNPDAHEDQRRDPHQVSKPDEHDPDGHEQERLREAVAVAEPPQVASEQRGHEADPLEARAVVGDPHREGIGADHEPLRTTDRAAGEWREQALDQPHGRVAAGIPDQFREVGEAHGRRPKHPAEERGDQQLRRQPRPWGHCRRGAEEPGRGGHREEEQAADLEEHLLKRCFREAPEHGQHAGERSRLAHDPRPAHGDSPIL